MAQTTITARVPLDIAAAAKAKAESEGLSLSAYVGKVLAVAVGGESEQVDEKPAWAIALEQRVSQLERRGQGRKGKRRR